jgi:hypothetical protein
MRSVEKEAPTRISVSLTPELYEELSVRAKEKEMSLNRTILQVLRAGLEAERQNKRRLTDMLRRYRESTDPQETERLGDELGAMIFGE